MLVHALWRVLALVGIILAVPAVAYGHAVVVETIPADGALVEAAPDHVVIRFNEPVAPVSAQVLNALGEEIASPDPPRVVDEALHIGLPPAIAEGSYIASYRVISADSHPVGGSIVFSVGRVSERVTAPIDAADERGWTAAMVLVRVVLYAGILGGAGGVLFLLLVRPSGSVGRATARMTARLAAAGSLSALLAIPVHGGQLRGGPTSILVDANTWWLGLTSGFGTTAAVAMIGLAIVAAALWPNRPAAPIIAYPAAAAALMSFALSGHIVTGGARWLTVPLLLTHTTAVAFWVGSLIPLHQAIRRSDAKAAAIVQRFSRVAVFAVAALVVAGLIIAVLQVESIGALISTTYGRVLLAKIGLVAGLLGLAVVNKLRLTPALAAGDPRAGPALRRTIAGELLLVFGILLATALLGATPPSRVLSGPGEAHAGHMFGHGAPAAKGLEVTMIGAGRSAEVVLDSDRSGINSAEIKLLDSGGSPVEAQEVTFIAANPSAGIESIRRTAETAGAGVWQVDNLLLVPSGEWLLRVDVLVSDFERATLETVVPLP